MKKNSLMEGAIIATIAIIFSKILGVLYVIPFYKIIGEQGGALYGYAYNIYNIFLIISSAGIPLAISKITSEYETKQEYQKKEMMYSLAKKVVLLFSIMSFLICFLFSKNIASLILGDLSGGNTIEDVSFVIKCVSFALLIVPLLSISRGYLQGHKYISPSSISQVIEQVIRIATILIGSYVAVKILNIPLTYAVGISVFSACVGAIFAYIYLHFKMKKIKVNKQKQTKLSKQETKEIIKKLIGYSLPFIIVNICNSLYNTTDMILVIRGLDMLNYSAADIENISSILTTWGDKLISIVRAIATGLTISLIPSIVSAYVSKDKEKVNDYFNKALQVLLYIILPLTIFMSMFAKEIWQIFYTNNEYGVIIFKYTILVATLDSAYVLIGSALQGLYKTKLIYISVVLGLVTNLILDLPLMFLFNKLGIYPVYGTITATVIGYLIALGIPLYSLYKKDDFSYQKTIKSLPRLFISIVMIIFLGNLYKKLVPTFNSYIGNIGYILIIGIIVVLIYIIMNKKMLLNILNDKIKKRIN